MHVSNIRWDNDYSLGGATKHPLTCHPAALVPSNPIAPVRISFLSLYKNDLVPFHLDCTPSAPNCSRFDFLDTLFFLVMYLDIAYIKSYIRKPIMTYNLERRR